ncbi:DNA-3-methyladenine glycosylase family protein [Nonomuraea sediminis]|uniref:DNA-3-methyladenine glycosylase family protein n=1 Tax=Nonomuraea sediminis TaxID=2835864 RepID=UPI001BDC2976
MTMLAAKAPFDFDATLRFLRGFPPTSGEQRVDRDSLTKALRAGGQTLVATLKAAEGGLEVSYAAAPTPAAEAEAADRLSFYLGLEDDLAEFYALGRSDAAFAPVVEALYGYHQVKFPSPLENLVWAILCQRVPMPVATKAKQALVAHVGNDRDAFPDLDQLLSLDQDELTALIGNTTKGARLHAALRRWAETDERHLRTAPYGEVKEFLQSLPGIGPWSASFILIRGLGRMDEAPVDRELLRSASAVYGPLSEDKARELAATYGPWQGYWAHYLRAAGLVRRAA